MISTLSKSTSYFAYCLSIWINVMFCHDYTQDVHFCQEYNRSDVKPFSVHHIRGFVVQSLSHVQLVAKPWTAACQAPLSSTLSQSLLKFMSIESVVLSNHLVLCCPLLLLPSIFSQHQGLFQWVGQSIGASTSPSVLINEYSGLISFRTDKFDLLAVHYLT